MSANAVSEVKMTKRIISGIIFGGIAIAALAFGIIPCFALVMVISGIASFEFYRALSNGGKKPMALPFVIMYISIPFAFNSMSDEAFTAIFKATGMFNWYPVFVFLAFASVMALFVFKNEKFNLEGGATSFLGGIYISALFPLILSIMKMENGLAKLLIALIGSVATDTFAYFTGSLFGKGKKKLCPKLSPKKTVIGAIGGTLGAIISCTVYGLIIMKNNGSLGLKIWDFAIMGLVIALISQIGDLFASAVKRECGIKDFGKIIPGHGGMLDRIDSIIPSVAVTYFYLAAISMIK